MDGFEVFVFCATYGMVAALFAAMLDEKENTLGRAFIWPMILLIASIKALFSKKSHINLKISFCHSQQV